MWTVGRRISNNPKKLIRSTANKQITRQVNHEEKNASTTILTTIFLDKVNNSLSVGFLEFNEKENPPPTGILYVCYVNGLSEYLE